MAAPKLKDWFSVHSGLLLKLSFGVFGVLFVTQVLLLLDFLPKLIGRPETFPTKGRCTPRHLEALNNLCMANQESASGELQNYWSRCFLAQFGVTFETDEPVLNPSDSSNASEASSLSLSQRSYGDCLFHYPASFTNKYQLVTTVGQLFQLNQTYNCWLNLSEGHCYLLENKDTLKIFIILESIFGTLLVVNIGFLIYINHVYQKLRAQI